MKRGIVVAGLVAMVLLTGARFAWAHPAAAKARHAKALFNLPAGYYITAAAICIVIGAAGGIAYAGIMGPKREREQGRDV